MSEMKHERPGVYSVYDASAVVAAGRGNKTVGVAAKALRGTVGEAVVLTGYTAGVAAFGEETVPGMSAILRLLFANGAATIVAVRVADHGALSDYEAAFETLGKQDVQIVVCDSADLAVQQALADSMKLLNEAAPNDQVIKLKALEALQKVADGKATKIIIPSELQGLAGLATSAKAFLSDDQEAE